MDVALLGPGDDLVDVRTDGLGADIEGLDAVVGEKGGDKVLLHCPGMRGIGAELHTLLLVVSHGLATPQ
ncbi:hypothetical protein IV77_GL001275 [Olsenella uli DSM 7084]|nr:hypothetical protein IV77_GL001275 [Olsenella uli DSM 7084]